MNERVETTVLRVLEEAGARHLEPETLRIFLLQVGGGPSLRIYGSGSVYWRRVQMVLDGFFTAPERAGICAQIVDEVDLTSRPEAWDFLASALAEQRLQTMREAPSRAAARLR